MALYLAGRSPVTVPTVSVLVKAFNHAAYVRQAIESVLTQSFQDFEIVITDDGSTDGTLDVLRGFADPRIRLEASATNNGISAAMNATIARARGRYLAILNSDDYALPGRLQRQVEFLDANPAVSVLFGMPEPVDEAGNATAAYNDFELSVRFPDFSRRTWLRQFFFHGNCLCAPTAMIRREAYEAAGPYDRRLTNLQDLDMWVRMLIAGHAIHVLPERLTAFRIRDNNANMSALRPDSMLRSAFETTKILAHFAALHSGVLQEVFGPELADIAEDAGSPLVTLALRTPAPAWQYFGLDLLYRTAREPLDFRRLQVLSGTVDALGIQAVAARESEIARSSEMLRQEREDHQTEVAHLVQQAALLRRQIAGFEQQAAQLGLQIAGLRKRSAHFERLCNVLEHSTSWRLTLPLRMIVTHVCRPLRRIILRSSAA